MPFVFYDVKCILFWAALVFVALSEDAVSEDPSVTGIMPTPQLNPSLDTKQFQNTAAYWSIKCSMTVEIDMDSLYALGPGDKVHSTNDNLIFFPNQDNISYNDIEPLGMESYDGPQLSLTTQSGIQHNLKDTVQFGTTNDINTKNDIDTDLTNTHEGTTEFHTEVVVDLTTSNSLKSTDSNQDSDTNELHGPQLSLTTQSGIQNNLKDTAQFGTTNDINTKNDIDTDLTNTHEGTTEFHTEVVVELTTSNSLKSTDSNQDSVTNELRTLNSSLALTVDSTFATMIWYFDASVRNLTLNVTTYCMDERNITKVTAVHLQSLPATKKTSLTNLLPGTSYNCSNALSDRQFRFIGDSTFQFRTNLSISDIDLEIISEDTFIEVRWNQTKGETNRISVTELYSNHFIPSSCVKENNSISISGNVSKPFYNHIGAVLDHSEEFFNYTTAYPDHFYVINVTGFNYNGEIISKGSGAVLTKPAAQDEVRHLKVSNNNVNKNQTFVSYQLLWQMPCSPNGNITSYNITIQGRYSENLKVTHVNTLTVLSEKNREDYEITLDFLRPSYQYEIGVSAKSQSFQGNWSYTHFTTPVHLPGPPEVDLNIKSTEITVEWNESDDMGEILSYTLEVKSLGPMYSRPIYCKPDNYSEIWTFNKSQTYYNIKDLNPYTKYLISVTASTSAGNRTTNVEGNTTDQAPEKVENITVSYNDHTNHFIVTNISWELPCLLNGQFTSTLVLISPDKSYNLGTELFLVTKLNYSTSYTVQVWLRLKDERMGNGAVFSFRTPDGFPGKVTDLNAASRWNSFDISWKPPKENGCAVIGYRIEVIALEPAYDVSSNCKNNMTRMHEYPARSVNGSLTQFKFDLKPIFYYYNYEIAVTAESKYSSGDKATKNVVSQTHDPEPVEYFNHSISDVGDVNYTAKATVMFVPPCYLNGPLIHYKLDYKADYKSKEIFNDSVIINGSYTFKLRPDYNYSYSITTYTKSYNSTTDVHRFRAPAGVPKLNIPLNQIAIVRTVSTAKFTLKGEYFDNTNGELQFIAILLANSSDLGDEVNSYDKYADADFPVIPQDDDVQVKVILKNPFEGMDAVEIVIGNGTCDDFYCNKPLEANHDYHLIIRAYTNDFYRNSHVIGFKTDDFSHIDIILGVLFGILFAVLAGLVTFYLWRKKLIKIPRLAFSAAVIPRKVSESQNVSLSTSYPSRKFISYFKYLENNPDIWKAQFATIKKNSLDYAQTLRTHFAKLPENRRKNRYTNISPFDETRVKLMIDEDDEIGSDYINASYIRGYSGEVEYIATQGPLESTCRDFWKMILQENVSVIVMVSLFIEQDKLKCYRYFPKNHETMLVGDDIEVRCCVELHFGIYCIRTFQIRKDNFQTQVTHMQFLEWPDFGVPASNEHMLQFCYQMRDRIQLEEGVIVVHCSAGVGRTGTLIATDILIQAANAGKNIDVFSTVEELRKERMHMVQTEEQYFYIHKLLVEHLDRPQSQEYSTSPGTMIDNSKIITPGSWKNKQKPVQESKF